MNDNLSAFVFLDNMLQWFAEDKRGKITRLDVWNGMTRKYPEYNLHDGSLIFTEYFDLALEKLAEDKYINRYEFTTEYPDQYRYNITFTGKCFWDIDKGYIATLQTRELEMKQAKAGNGLLIVGSWLAGLGTFLLFLLEIVKKFHWLVSVELWTYVFVAFLGIVAGIVFAVSIIQLLSWQSQRLKEK